MSRKSPSRVAYGRNPALINISNDPIIGNRAPLDTDTYEPGQLAVDQVTNAVYMLTSYVAGSPIWTRLDSNAAVLGLNWVVDATLGPVALDSNYGYRLTNAGAVSLVLPVNSTFGDQIWIVTDDSSAAGAGITIDVGATQTITFGDQITSAGAGTKFIATHPGAVASGMLAISIILVCTVDDTAWNVFSCNVIPNLI